MKLVDNVVDAGQHSVCSWDASLHWSSSAGHSGTVSSICHVCSSHSIQVIIMILLKTLYCDNSRSMVQEDLKKWNFQSLRHCVSAGEPLNEEVIYNWEEGTHLVIKEGYGQTETTLLLGTFKKMSKWVKPGSMGKVAPGYDVRIVNNMGIEVPRGEQGNIGVRVKPHTPPGLFKVSQDHVIMMSRSILFTISFLLKYLI